MGKLTLILGGARSGKSRYAAQIAESSTSRSGIVFLATAEPGDEDMASRIRRHRAERPADWRTVEVPTDVVSALRELGDEAVDGCGQTVVILDCVTLWISNLLLSGGQEVVSSREESILAEVRALIGAARNVPVHLILVSNEVGLGVVPPTRLGRVFRDIAGRANQALAEAADEVYVMWAGLPQRIK